MDTDQHDKAFVNTFIGVLGALFGLTFIIIAIASSITSGDDEELTQAERTLIEQRLEPIGAAVTDPNAIVKVAAASEDTSSEPRSGEEIVQAVCSGCHMAGVLNAPKLDDGAAWSALVDSKGMKTLIKHAIDGFNAMPPRGGDSSLSDAEVGEAVNYMVDNSGA